jgi:hypothetical protein
MRRAFGSGRFQWLAQFNIRVNISFAGFNFHAGLRGPLVSTV